MHNPNKTTGGHEETTHGPKVDVGIRLEANLDLPPQLDVIQRGLPVILLIVYAGAECIFLTLVHDPTHERSIV